MKSIDFLLKILNTKLPYYDLKWCLVDSKKLPYMNNGKIAKTNDKKCFCNIEELMTKHLLTFSGVGVSINYSHICAIDIDKCVEIPFDIKSISIKGKEILEMFKNYYCEFSFSGTGLRILFYLNELEFLESYKKNYYTKNSKQKIEFYLPLNIRYVTITGEVIYNNELRNVDISTLKAFLDKYMLLEKRKENIYIKQDNNIIDEKEINKKLKKLFINNLTFLEVWNSKAPGSGKNESELDYYLIKVLFENVTSNFLKIKELLESSDYYLSKDKKHKKKWNETNYLIDTYSSIKRI